MILGLVGTQGRGQAFNMCMVSSALVSARNIGLNRSFGRLVVSVVMDRLFEIE